jgi:hypothetical protein
MDSNEFVTWLKGFVEACGTSLSVTQLTTVKNKLKSVREVKCNNFPTTPYTPPTIGDNPYPDPNRIWYTTTTGYPSFSTDETEYNKD